MRVYRYLILVGIVFGCQDVKRPELPADLISKERIIDIYTDAYLMNSARSINMKILTDNGINLDATIYKKYNIDSLQFVKSNAYYSADLNEYLSIFEEVQERLVQLEVKKDSTDLMEVLKAESEIMIDSITNSGLIEPVKTDSN